MRNWKLFEPRKLPIVIDFYGWMEDPLVRAAQRADIGWSPVVWTKPYFELPPEPSPVPFRHSLLCSAVMDVILNRPLFIQPYYQDTSFNIADYISEPKSLKRFFDLWGEFIHDADSA